MEKIFFVEEGDLNEVNEILEKGGTVKKIVPVAECVSGEYDKGNVYAYIVVSHE